MSFQFLETRRDGSVEHLTLRRPDVRNALNDELIAEMTHWAEQIATDPEVRCVVLAGDGPVFCAGADLTWMSRTVGFTHDENLRDANAAARLYALLDRLPMATIARVHGAAIGGGAGLAAVCDVAIADDATVFGFSEVKLGILPAVISPYVVAKIGLSATRHLFVTGARFSASHAVNIGLIHAVVPRADLDAHVAQYVREVLCSGPQAVAAVKLLLHDIAHRNPADAVGLTSEAIALRRVSVEGQEGMKAFLEKRKATWVLGQL